MNDGSDLELMNAPSMDPQPFCSYCGAASPTPNKVRWVTFTDAAGVSHRVRLEYPEGIDAHHVCGHHQGPVVYLCHECHMRHHQVVALQFRYVDGKFYAGPRGQHLRELVTAAEWDH